jgi:1-acyl-sn-glycerol-3-phosphate acyltransferase
LRLLGWRITGEIPNERKFIILVGPHTSNWDFVIAFLAYLALELRASWFGKRPIFRAPFGVVLRYFGGIPVWRGADHIVEQSIAAFRDNDAFILALAPEGTRRRLEKWRSGFHRIALGAGVPLLPVSLDFAKREVGVGPLLTPSSDYATNVRALAERFSQATARHPARFNPEPRV